MICGTRLEMRPKKRKFPTARMNIYIKEGDEVKKRTLPPKKGET